MGEVRALLWMGNRLRLLDQTRLPGEEVYLDLEAWSHIVEAIKELRVRGAPALGVAGAYALALAGQEYVGLESQEFHRQLGDAAEQIAGARPTAVNLAWAVRRALQAAQKASSPGAALEFLLTEARDIETEDLAANRQIGTLGAELIPFGATVLTHCNTGSLATAGYGTALGVIRTAWAQGKVVDVIATETRPLLQGARLTAWELVQEGIPVTLVVEGAVGHVLRQGRVDAMVVGADRIAANGDVANKIGTYTLAVLGRAHGVPAVCGSPPQHRGPGDAERRPHSHRGARRARGGRLGRRCHCTQRCRRLQPGLRRYPCRVRRRHRHGSRRGPSPLRGWPARGGGHP